MKPKTTKLIARAEQDLGTGQAVLERGEHFTRSGTLDPKYHRWLLDASRARNSADYDVEVDFTPENAATSIERAREFVAAVQRLLSTTG